jgi:hypothetical protein
MQQVLKNILLKHPKYKFVIEKCGTKNPEVTIGDVWYRPTKSKTTPVPVWTKMTADCDKEQGKFYFAVVTGYEDRLTGAGGDSDYEEYSEYEDYIDEIQSPKATIPGYDRTELNKNLGITIQNPPLSADVVYIFGDETDTVAKFAKHKSSGIENYKIGDGIIWELSDKPTTETLEQLVESAYTAMSDLDYCAMFKPDDFLAELQTIKHGEDTYYFVIFDAESG